VLKTSAITRRELQLPID
jgi:hypothetical protein